MKRRLSNDALAADLLSSAGVIALPPPSLSYDEVFGHLKVMDDHDRIVPFRRNRAQIHFAQHRTGRDLLLKARQLGFSTDIQADQYARAVSRTIRCATLAHDDATTQKLRRMAERFHDNLPARLRPPRGLDNAATTTYPRTQSEVTIATAGAQNAGRGGTYNTVHGSEVAFWRDARKIVAGLLQGVPEDGDIALESTPNGAYGWFFEQCMRALDPKAQSIWTLHFYAWWWKDEYRRALAPGEVLAYTPDEQRLVDLHGLTPEQIQWRRAKIDEFGDADLFQQEYPEDPVRCFLSSGKSAFGAFYHALRPSAETAPQPGCVYVAGNDWGQVNDYSALAIFNATTLQEVCLERWRGIPWDEMKDAMVALCQHWRVRVWVSEQNSGSSNVPDLEPRLERAGLTTHLIAKPMSNPFKADLVANFKNGLETAGLTLLDIAYATQELTAFTAGRTASGLYTYAAARGDHDDTVLARLLAYYAVQRQATYDAPLLFQARVKGR